MLLALFLGQPSEAGWKKSCVAYFSKLHQEAEVERYGYALGYTIRALFKDPEPLPVSDGTQAVPQRRWLGFLSLHVPPEKINRWLAWFTPNLQAPLHYLTRAMYGNAYSFSATGPLSYHLLRPTIRETTRYVFGRPKEFTLGVNILLGGIVAAALYDFVIDEPFQQAVIDKILKDIPKHADELRPMIESDYRFGDIRKGLASKKLTEKEALELAFIRNHYYAKYYAFMRDEYPHMEKEAARGWLMQFPAFHPIADIKEKGVGRHPYYFYKEEFQPAVTKEQADKLVDLTVWKLNMDQGVAEWVSKGMPDPGKMEAAQARTLGAFLDEPYAQALTELHKRGRLSAPQLQQSLQEDLHWQTKFRWWETLNLGRLKLENGEVTDEALTLKDVRKETLRELAKIPGPAGL